MTYSKNNERIVNSIIVLLAINYMVITVVLHDNLFLKYIRDILLIILIFKVIFSHRFPVNNSILIYLSFFIFLVLGARKADSINIAFLSMRRYIFPLLFLFVISNINFSVKYTRILIFILKFTFLLSVFGIIQAMIFGDSFLRFLGYPLEYSYTYGRMMLYNSFYFGGLGIQRVVATYSSSNICALVLGVTLIFLVIYKDLGNKPKRNQLFLIVISVAYILTFSRSNYLALFLCILLFAWDFIPYKKNIVLGISMLFFCIIIINLYQGSGGIFYKIWGWIQSTIHMTDSSAAGRLSIWIQALKESINNPFGIGVGHVGAIGIDSNKVFSTENSYLTLALDTGWIGMLIYMVGLIRFVKLCKKGSQIYYNNGDYLGFRLCKAAEVVIIYLMIVMFFSNHIQDMEAISIIYLYLGLALSYMRFQRKGEN